MSDVEALALEAWEWVSDQLTSHSGGAADLDERALAHELAVQWLERQARQRLVAGEDALSHADEDRILGEVSARLRGLGLLDLLRQDSTVENIVANGCDQVFIYRADGSVERGPTVARSDEELVEMVRSAAARLGRSERRFDIGSPFVDLRLPDGSRMQAAMAVSGRPCVSIRVHRHRHVTLDDLVELNTLDKALHGFLRAAVRARLNIVVCGGTDAGKTTMLRGLINEIDPIERLITIEDRLELGLATDTERHPNVVEFETRPPNIEGEGAIEMQRLVKEALAMRPDRLIVGEVRGPEVIDMLNAMSIGNDGSMCTIHANSTQAAFQKIGTYALRSEERLPPEATARMMADGLHFVLHVRKLENGQRVVSSVRHVVGVDGATVQSNEIFAPDRYGRACPATQIRTDTMDQLIAAGLDESLLWNEHGWWGT